MPKPSWKKGIPLSAEVQARLRELLHETGDEKKVAERLEVSATSILRGALGLGMQRGTILLIETRLATIPKAA